MLFLLFCGIIYIEWKGIYMKNRIKKKKITLIILSVIAIICVVGTYLIINYEESGSTNIDNEYYEIMFGNVFIDFETTMEVQPNNNDKSILINIPDLNEFKIKKEFTIDIQNIGNKNAIVSRMFLNHIESNVDSTLVNISISYDEGRNLLGGTINQIIVGIEYLGEDLPQLEMEDATPTISFSINYTFK